MICQYLRRPFTPSLIHIRCFSSTFKLRKDPSEIPTDRIRNIGIIAHIDAGKTTITERMLYYAGYTQRIGDVDSGSTVTDYLPAERSRGITITSACIPLFWNNNRINLIDTPGHVDFTMEVERSVRILDSAVVLLDGVAGVEAQTETVWKQANRQKIPRLILVNKMDREGSSFPRALAAISNRLKGWGQPVPIQWPIFAETATGIRFRGVFDLVEMEVIDFLGSETGSVVRRRRVDGGEESFVATCCTGDDALLAGIEKDRVVKVWQDIQDARVNLVEQLAALDDEVVEAFLEEADGSHLAVKASVLKPALRRLTGSGKVVPVLCGSAFKNTGVQPVMDAVVDYLPSPSERPAPVATKANGDITTVDFNDKAFCGLAFKIIHDEKRGAMVFIRVYSGSLQPRSMLFNSSQNITERATKILQMYADDYEEIPKVSMGNIACVLGLTETKTGDTLLLANEHGIKGGASGKKSSANAPLPTIKPPASSKTLETIYLPPPVFIRSVEPVSSSDTRKLESSLNALVREDPSLVVTTDPDSGQTLLGGMGELHLEIASERLLDTHKCAAQMGKVSISYRETIPAEVGPVDCFLDYDKEIFGKHSKLSVSLVIEGRESCEEWIDVSEGNGNTIDLDSRFDVADMYPVPLLMVPSRNGKGKPVPTAPFGYPSIQETKEALRDGIQGALARGPILGFPVVNLKVTVVEVKLFKPELTSLGAVRAATGRCMRDAMRGVPMGGGPVQNPPTRLLEPIMNLSVTVPEKYVGTVTKDLTGTRRGSVVSLGTEDEHGGVGVGGAYESHVISATVPLGSMLGYATNLRGMTAGTGLFSMQLLGYGKMSVDREEAVLKDMKGY
ncbi:Ribosome-releasing factor 2, mitochondrial [Podochytrium sp. JEL0797]|nr:Ribosome-releasing factor 2, mitochondrial [Podochytrium sp. JEL0797]